MLSSDLSEMNLCLWKMEDTNKNKHETLNSLNSSSPFCYQYNLENLWLLAHTHTHTHTHAHTHTHTSIYEHI